MHMTWSANIYNVSIICYRSEGADSSPIPRNNNSLLAVDIQPYPDGSEGNGTFIITTDSSCEETVNLQCKGVFYNIVRQCCFSKLGSICYSPCGFKTNKQSVLSKSKSQMLFAMCQYKTLHVMCQYKTLLVMCQYKTLLVMCQYKTLLVMCQYKTLLVTCQGSIGRLALQRCWAPLITGMVQSMSLYSTSLFMSLSSL